MSCGDLTGGATRPTRAARAVGVLVAGAALALAGCTEAPPEVPEPSTVAPTFDRSSPPEPVPPPEPTLGAWGVSAGHPAAVQAGSEVLADGGSAVDAAIAAAFAVSVVAPFASGIGGGGAAILVPPGGPPVSYDYREVVPASGAVPATDAGVPGFVAGLGRLHAEHGELDWSRLLEPAVELAREGHPASQMMATQLRSGAGVAAAGGLGHLYPSGVPLARGDAVVQDDLAATLESLARGGAEELYSGELAESLVASVDGLDAESLEGYAVQVSDPPSGVLGDHEVVSAAPPLPGIALIQMVQIAEALGVGDAQPGSAQYIDLMAAAWAEAARTVERDLGDPDFVDVPVAEVTDAERNAALAEAIRSGASTTSVRDEPEAGETTHITVVDDDGLLVSMTNTLTYFWGSGQYVDGYFMNNQMVRFSVGAGGGNTPEPGRRSVSWSMPTVVLDADGRAVLGLGSPGGERIPTVLADVIVRWALHGQELGEAVPAGRFHASAGEIELERIESPSVAEELRGRGYAVQGPFEESRYLFGSVQALAIDWEAGAITGAADSRREADVAIGD